VTRRPLGTLLAVLRTAAASLLASGILVLSQHSVIA
jgi:hypothetical protein